MAKKYYSRSLKCSDTDCKEFGHYTYSSQREMNQHYKEVKTFTCNRHLYPNEVLGIDNKLIIVEEIAQKSIRYPNLESLFWSRCNSGFTYGTGFKAYANDFPEGTILRVTAEIIYPKK